MFKLYCDRCQDFIKMLKQRGLSDFKRDDPIICDQCKRTETQMNQMIERMRDQVKVLVEDAAMINEVFGGPTFRRYPACEAAYASVGSNCQFVIFPGVGHVWPDWSFIKEFLERNRVEPSPAPLPKPMLHKSYFPHVASFDAVGFNQ